MFKLGDLKGIAMRQLFAKYKIYATWCKHGFNRRFTKKINKGLTITLKVTICKMVRST